MPDLGPLIIIFLLFGLGGGLIWAFRKKYPIEASTPTSSSANSTSTSASTAVSTGQGLGSETESGLAFLWTAAGVLGAIVPSIVALVLFSNGEMLLGLVTILSVPFVALGPFTVAYGIRWSLRVETLLKAAAAQKSS